MSKYPLSSLDRICSRVAKTPCQEYPCEHIPCHDPDWLDDLEESYQDERKHVRLWKCFRDPEHYKSAISKKKWKALEAKFPRCQRIDNQRAQIDAQIKRCRTLPLVEVKDELKGIAILIEEFCRWNTHYRTAEQEEGYLKYYHYRHAVASGKKMTDEEGITYEEWMTQLMDLPEKELRERRLYREVEFFKFCTKEIEDLAEARKALQGNEV